jgi:hypothetical protein
MRPVIVPCVPCREPQNDFRQIVSDIYGLSGGAAKHDHRQGGQQKWLEKAHSISLSEITAGKVQD